MSGFQAKDLFSAAGKNVVITGGSKGIGLMLARGLVANGANVYLTSRKLKTCLEAADSINREFAHVSGAGKAVGFASDVSGVEGCDVIFKALQDEGVSELHILINNAGTNWAEPLDTYPESAFKKQFNLNVFGYFALVQKLVPLLERGARSSHGPSKIINMGSINGIDVPSLDTFAYSASKAAVHQLTRVLAFKLAPRNITVNAIAPGPFRSKMMQGTLDKLEDKIVAGIPMKRLGEPEDMIAVVLWLTGKGGNYVTGSIIPVDGGALVSTSKM